MNEGDTFLEMIVGAASGFQRGLMLNAEEKAQGKLMAGNRPSPGVPL